MKKKLLLIITLINLSVFGQSYQVSTLAGNGTAGDINGAGTTARFNSMAGSTTDNDGNIYVCDFSSHKIRKITPTGDVTTFAGSGTAGFLDGSGTSARFNGPHDICFDKENNLFYVADRENHRIRRIDSNGNVTTVAGNSTSGIVNGVGINARFNSPSGIDVDMAGNLVVADRLNHAIRKIIVATGEVTTLSGNGIQGLAYGANTNARYNNPTDVIINKNGFCYITDYGNNLIRVIDYNGGSSYLTAGSGTAGTSDGTSYVTAQFDGPYSLAFLNSTIIVTDRNSHRIRKIDFVKQIVETIAGNNLGFVNGNGTSATFNSPSGIAVYGNTLYVSDWYNYSLRKVNQVDSCVNATVLSSNSGTVTMGTLNGNIPVGTYCYGSYSSPNPNANANWWSFTPTQNGLLNISTVTPENATTVNTRLAILSGTCGNLVCHTFNDNISSTDLRSRLTEVILTAGTTYYFVWDDIYTDNGAVNFEYSFTPQTCFRPDSAYIFDAPTDNSVHIGWTAPSTGDTTPDSYTLEIGLSGFTPGTGTALQTIASTTETNQLFLGLNPGTLYSIYIKSTCAPSDISSWRGINSYTQFPATTINYTENFDASSNYLNQGWNRNPGVTNTTTWSTNTSSSVSQSGNNSITSRVEYNTPSNSYVYSRKLNLVTGQNYRVSYYIRKIGDYTDGKYKVLLVSNNTYYLPTNHTVIHNNQNLTDLNYALKEHDFTVNTNAAYRIGFKNESSKNIYYTLGGGLYLDTFSVSTVLSVNEFEKSGLLMYPNPVLDHITIQNPENIQIKNYSVMDMNGRILISRPYSVSNEVIDLTSLSKGIYFIQLDSEKGTLSKKIIKE